MKCKAKKLGQFYTPPEVAHELIQMLNLAPQSVIDLGCGLGSLSEAAVSRWGAGLQLVTLDIDPLAGPSDTAWTEDHEHFTINLLDHDPFTKLISPAQFDAAVLNPPYGRRVQCALETTGEGGLTDAKEESYPFPHTHCRATIFTLHALRAVRLGGLVAAILPETLASGGQAAKNREMITSCAIVRSLKSLPAGTFAGTEARTVMVLFQRTDSKVGTKLAWKTPKPNNNCNPEFSTLQELGVSIVRGRLGTIDARRAQAFHLTGFASARNGSVKLHNCSEEKVSDDRAAKRGDILVARVGRGIPEKVARVTGGTNTISDCVYRLRCAPIVNERVWRGLRSPFGKMQMESFLSGVTTRVLPVNALLTLRV